MKHLLTKENPMKFVKFLSEAHLNDLNIAVYDDGTARIENVRTGKALPVAPWKFVDVEDAVAWFKARPGANDISKLATALEYKLPKFHAFD